MTEREMTYGEALADPTTVLHREAARLDRDRATVLADLAAQGITGVAAWEKIIAEGLLR